MTEEEKAAVDALASRLVDDQPGDQANVMLFEADEFIRSGRAALERAESHMRRTDRDPGTWARIATGWATLSIAAQGMARQLTEDDDAWQLSISELKADLAEVVEVLRPIAAEHARRLEDPGPKPSIPKQGPLPAGSIWPSDRPLDPPWSLEKMMGGSDLVIRSEVKKGLDEYGFHIQDLPAGKLETHRCTVIRKGKKGDRRWVCDRSFSDGVKCGKVWSLEPDPDARHTSDRYLTS